jgi:predicted permease
MTFLGKLAAAARRAVARTRRDRLDEELAEEIRGHLALRTRALIDEGLDPRAAADEARRLFGNVTIVREESRDMWGFPAVETIAQDLRYGARLLRRSPTFTLVTVTSLAIGIGAACGVFALADTVLFRELPVKAPRELVLVRWTSGPRAPFESLSGYGQQLEAGLSSTSFALVAFERMRDTIADRADLFGFADLDRVAVSVGGRADISTAQAVSGNYFSALGVTPVAGRPILPSDDAAGAPPVAVVSEAFAEQHFGSAQAAVGRHLLVNAASFTIVGVSPRAFGGTLQVGARPAIAVPLSSYGTVVRDDDPRRPNFWWVLMMARLKPGVMPAHVQPQIELVMRQTVAAARPELTPADLPQVSVEPGSRGQTENRAAMVEPLQTMAIAAGVILLVACANVAGLLLARGRARAREIAVRVAIGAPRRRVVRQLLTEGLLLAALGSALGLLVARWAAGALVAALADGAPGATEISVGLDWRAVAFAIAAAALCTIVFGLLPSLRATDVRVASGLGEARRGAVEGRHRLGLGNALVVVQVALSMLLVTGAGVLAWSVRNLLNVDPGFSARGLLLFRVNPQQNGYDQARVRQTYETALERLRALPGVRGASLTSHVLIANSSAIGLASRTDEPRPQPSDAEVQRWARTHRAWRLLVDETFFSTSGIRLLRGRPLERADNAAGAQVAVINEALARQLFGTTDAVGRQFLLGLRHGDPPLDVVGVAADAKYTSLRDPAPPTVYLSFRQQPVRSAAFMVRTDGDPIDLAPAVRAAMQEVDATLPITDLRTQTQQIDRSLARERLLASLATWLAMVALLLSAIGVYGLIAYGVARRTAEIGVRMALGAGQRDVRWMVLRQSVQLAIAGVAIGAPAAFWGTGVLESLVFGVAAADPVVISAAAALMVVTAVFAGYVPARRAAAVDPLVALRAE